MYTLQLYACFRCIFPLHIFVAYLPLIFPLYFHQKILLPGHFISILHKINPPHIFPLHVFNAYFRCLFLLHLPSHFKILLSGKKGGRANRSFTSKKCLHSDKLILNLCINFVIELYLVYFDFTVHSNFGLHH